MELRLRNHSEVPGMADKSAADGLISGLGKVNGRPVVVEAPDKTVFAATSGAICQRKTRLAHEFAIKRGLPIINLGEGGGKTPH